MIRKFKQYSVAFLLCAFALGPAATHALAQTALSATTLSASVDNSTAVIPVTSATGMAAQVNAGPAYGAIGDPSSLASYVLYVDTEAIIIRGINLTTNTITVAQRGAQGTKAEFHNSGAKVVFGPSTAFVSFDQEGSCTFMINNSNRYLPAINLNDGKGFYCPTIGSGATATGQWVWATVGTMNSAPAYKFFFGCTGTAGSAETEYLDFGACSGQTTATLGRQVVANTGTIYNLRVSSSAAAVGGTGKSIVTIFKNGSATTLTCQIVATALVCNDTTHGFAVVPGDYLYAQFVSATSETAANLAVTFDER